jgi:hypothetical protein
LLWLLTFSLVAVSLPQGEECRLRVKLSLPFEPEVLKRFKNKKENGHHSLMRLVVVGCGSILFRADVSISSH